jgi:hypothetical protein
MATSNRNLTVTRDEYAIFGRALPYIAMLIGAGLLFLVGVLSRLGIYAQYYFSQTDIQHSSEVTTWVILFSLVILSAVAWKLFSQRNGMFIKQHATLTVVLGHLWLLMSVWEDKGDWLFGAPTAYAFFWGAGIVGLSWCIRRWAFRGDDAQTQEQENIFEEIGLGDTKIDKRNSRATANGATYRLKLALGKTVENAKDKRTAIAQIAGKPRSLVHVSETADGVEGQVDVTILKADPFKEKHFWQGPDYPGDSIVSPITYATYDTGDRPELFLAGKNGGSSQHFLTMGMSGTGKSKAWQVIYGSVLNRREVSVVFGDPAKGMQTGGPLAAGLEWFATTEAECHEQIQAIMAAIPVRTNYLTSKGLDHWQKGCGLNFVIFHLEEAARFAEVDELIEMIEAARSAGISIVISLQRATNDRLKTSARYNLGGNMCFGVKMKRDASFGLSEYAIEAGASPHMWQDKKPGYHYLEAAGLDATMAGHMLVSDWIDIARLEQEVDNGADIRTPLDTVTAEAFGMAYAGYRENVASGNTNWQQMRKNRGHDSTTLEIATENPPAITREDGSVVATARVRPNNLGVTPEEKAAAENALWALIYDWADHGKNTFSHKEVVAQYNLRGPSWVSTTLNRWVKEGSLFKENGLYSVLNSQ